MAPLVFLLPGLSIHMPPPDDICRLERHCPRLGGMVRFDYCRTGGHGGEPCGKSLDCWWERFDVVGYFRHRLSRAAFTRLIHGRPPEKVASLVTLIRQARQRTGK